MRALCRNFLATLLLLSGAAAMAADADNIAAIERDVARAVVELDFDVLEATYADEFVFYHSTGVVEGKDDWLRKLRAGEAVYTARIVDNIEVDVIGEQAVSSGRIHLRMDTDNPDRKAFTVWYFRIYERRAGRWQMVMHRSLHEEIGPLEE